MSLKDDNVQTTPESGNPDALPPIPETVSLDDLADSLVNGWPEPKAHVVGDLLGPSPDPKQSPTPEDQGEKPLDSKGDPLDPSIHMIKDGEGVKRKDGTWRKKTGAAARKFQENRRQQESHVAVEDTPESATGNAQEGHPQLSPEKKQAQVLLAAKTATSMFIMGGNFIGGAEWNPRQGQVTLPGGVIQKIDEREQLESAFFDYFQAKDIDDIPPGLALTCALLVYAHPRMQMEVTRSKWGRFKEWVKLKIQERRARKVGTQSYNRADVERENNPREGSGQTVQAA